jgi:hypothetical protein
MLKSVSSITNAVGALNYRGTWDAFYNTPTITSGAGTKGDYYQVSVAGTTTIDGLSNWGIGDIIAFNGTTWQRIEGGADGNFVQLTSTSTTTLNGTTIPASKTLVVSTDVGSSVQAYDAGLTSIAGLTTAANKMIYTTAADTYAVADLTAAGRAILDDADNVAQRTTLGLGTMATQAANSVSITGGSIEGTTVGATTASSGRFSSIANTALTSGRLVYSTTNGAQTDSASLTYDGSRLVANKTRNSQFALMMAFVQSMIDVGGSGGCASGGPNMTFKSVTVNSSAKAMFASSSTGTPAGYKSFESDEGYFVTLIIDCGNNFGVTMDTTIPSFRSRVYIRDDWSVNTLI